MKKWLIIGGVIVVVAILVVVNLQKQKGKATEVELEAIEKRELTEIVSASGTIQPKISVDISSDITGKIVEVFVNEGDRVSDGELLLRVDPTQFRESVRSAEAQYESAKARYRESEARLEQAELEWARIKAFHEKGDVSERDYESARMSYKVAGTQVESSQRSVEQAEAYLEQMRDRFSKTEIRSPMSGIVVRRNAEVGEIAMEGTFSIQVLMVIADLSVMEVEVDVDETEIPQVALGQMAEVEIDAFPDDKFVGEVTEIANSPIQNQGGTGGVDFEVVVTLGEGYSGLRPGLSATANVTTAARDSALSIPIQALTLRTKKMLEEDQKKNATRIEAAGIEDAEFEFDEEVKELEGVFVIREGRALFRHVETGIAGEKHFELVTGLEAGDKIVTGPMRTLRNLHHGEQVKEKKGKKEDVDLEEDDDEGGGASVTVQ
jgi:HlyD family secretion protein